MLGTVGPEEVETNRCMSNTPSNDVCQALVTEWKSASSYKIPGFRRKSWPRLHPGDKIILRLIILDQAAPRRSGFGGRRFMQVTGHLGTLDRDKVELGKADFTTKVR